MQRSEVLRGPADDALRQTPSRDIQGLPAKVLFTRRWKAAPPLAQTALRRLKAALWRQHGDLNIKRPHVARLETDGYRDHSDTRRDTPTCAWVGISTMPPADLAVNTWISPTTQDPLA